MACCQQTNGVAPAKPRVLLTVDNYGGYSHPGRRITVQEGGTFQESAYTDVLGVRTNRTGNALLNFDQGTLRLMFAQGTQEFLIRARHGAIDYWVHTSETNRIDHADETVLRQRSLRNKR